MSQVQDYVDRHRERFLEELVELLSIPSVSTDDAHKPDVLRCADWVAEHLEDAGLETEILETDGHPAVYAERVAAPGQPTVLIYGHYDVQPPDPIDLWRHGPFTPVVEDGYLIARGATDDKGQFYSLVKGVQAALSCADELPVNVKLLIEGEEEIGSPNLAPVIRREKERLGCDVVFISDCSQLAIDVPAITYGLRGMAYFELVVRGPDKDLHSGSYGGAVANPANVLTRLISACQDPFGRIAVPGFYDKVRELSPEERTAFAELPFDEASFLKETVSPQTCGE
ncbi:MAG: M20/M25/M40 family metallo-hydrolase, partial [Planctomycetota bacterium]